MSDAGGDCLPLIRALAKHRSLSLDEYERLIVCRTEEISKKEDSAESLDSEEAEEQQSPWQRIARVFRKIWEGMRSVLGIGKKKGKTS